VVDAVFFDDFCDVWSFEVGVNGVVIHVPWCVYDETKNCLINKTKNKSSSLENDTGKFPHSAQIFLNILYRADLIKPPPLLHRFMILDILFYFISYYKSL
jgi:hypothetical protein